MTWLVSCRRTAV